MKDVMSPGIHERIKALQRCRFGYTAPSVHAACASKVLLFDGPHSKPFRGRVCEHEAGWDRTRRILGTSDIGSQILL
jgi:hypothetical protein